MIEQKEIGSLCDKGPYAGYDTCCYFCKYFLVTCPNFYCTYVEDVNANL